MGVIRSPGHALRGLVVALLAALLLAGARSPAPARGVAPLAPIVGEPQKTLVEPEDTLLDVAYRFRLGFDRVARLNPGVSVWIPNPGTVVDLPTEHILPDVPHEGLVINVPEMQLYDFTRRGGPEIYAVAIGDEMDPSLIGTFRIGAKREHPAWTVPASIRAEKPELPAVVAPGPDNPLGDYWMTIGNTTYGVHGTNNPWSIGRMATHGCVRLYNDQMAKLFAHIKVGTPVRLMYESVKLGRRGDGIYLEAHPDLYGREPDRAEAALQRLDALGLASAVDAARLRRAIADEQGVPIRIGTLPPEATTPATSRSAS